MASPHYYNGTIKKYVHYFGSLFNEMTVSRRSGNNTSYIHVPIVYAGKSRYIDLLQRDPRHDRKVGVSLPRISFNLSTMQYDSSRRVNRQNEISVGSAVEILGYLGKGVELIEEVGTNALGDTYSHLLTTPRNNNISNQPSGGGLEINYVTGDANTTNTTKFTIIGSELDNGLDPRTSARYLQIDPTQTISRIMDPSQNEPANIANTVIFHPDDSYTKVFLIPGADEPAKMYNPVPYNFDFEMAVYVKTAEDGAQMVEQICPLFQPEYTSSLILIPQLPQLRLDVPIILNSIQSEEQYELDAISRNALIWTFSFTLRGYLFPRVREGGRIITQAGISYFTPFHEQISQTLAFDGANNNIALTETDNTITSDNQTTTSSISLITGFSDEI